MVFKKWVSICSAHQKYDENCPTCQEGFYENPLKNKLSSIFYFIFPVTWAQKFKRLRQGKDVDKSFTLSRLGNTIEILTGEQQGFEKTRITILVKDMDCTACIDLDKESVGHLLDNLKLYYDFLEYDA